MALILVPSPSLNGSPSPRPLQGGRKPSKSHYKVVAEWKKSGGGVVVGGGRSSKCGEMSKNIVIGLPSESRFRSFVGVSWSAWSIATTVPGTEIEMVKKYHLQISLFPEIVGIDIMAPHKSHKTMQNCTLFDPKLCPPEVIDMSF